LRKVEAKRRHGLGIGQIVSKEIFCYPFLCFVKWF
jgi:hypothetical protein